MSEIYNIIDKKKLDIVSKPIHEAHGLPNECYTNKEYTLCPPADSPKIVTLSASPLKKLILL